MVPLHYLPVQDGLDRVTLGKEQLFMTTSFLRTQYNLTLDLVATYPSSSEVGGASKRSADILPKSYLGKKSNFGPSLTGQNYVSEFSNNTFGCYLRNFFHCSGMCVSDVVGGAQNAKNQKSKPEIFSKLRRLPSAAANTGHLSQISSKLLIAI